MKNKLVSILSLAVALCAAAFAAEPVITDQRTVLSRLTDEDGITTSVYVGRISCDPSTAGDFPVTVHFSVVKTTASGKLVAQEQISNTVPALTFSLQPQAAAGVMNLVKAALDARTAAQTPAPTPEPAPVTP
jgi:hypothetical protein